MLITRSPLIISNLSKNNLIWHLPASQNEIFLTFDDGPTIVTHWVLDVLKYYNIKATFFCVGDNIKRNPDIFKRILNEGHAKGNHTFNHINAFKTSNKDYFDNVDKADKLINSQLFRPPYGKINISKIKTLRQNYAIVLWSILTGDYDKNISGKKCFSNSLKTSSGSIIVFHDSIKAEKNLKYALPRFIEYFLIKKYIFSPITIDVCLNNSDVQRNFLAQHKQASYF